MTDKTVKKSDHIKKINFNNFPVKGIRLGVACAGIKKQNHNDLVLIEIAVDSNTAAVFTQNAFCAAPVTLAKKHLSESEPRFLLINTGNANAGTGQRGLKDAETCCQSVADENKVRLQQILPFSTGVIGEYLPVEKFSAAIKNATGNLSKNNWEKAAYGILTTDTVAKAFTRSLTLKGEQIRISGMAKGSGMIRPDMATMLAYIATDAKIEKSLLQTCLKNAVNLSFNRITVDGDTSTNDSALLIATGLSPVTLTETDSELVDFQHALTDVCENLAKEMIRDGEGATKLITVNVNGCANEQEANDVAYTVAHSPLVKTAFFASDPNWGRILAAIGRAGVSNLDLGRITVKLDDVCIVDGGVRADDYTEARGQAVMDKSDITIHIDLGRGESNIQIWTCDFSYDYIRINAEYRT